MRKDMFKVIVERPRVGGGYAKPGRKPKDLDDLPTKESMKKRHSSSLKELNENLAPLRRFLMKNVGRPWNDIYSEICKNIKVNSTVQRHVREHVDRYVEHTIEIDGKLHTVERGYYPLSSYSSYGAFYVDSKGILRHHKNDWHKNAWKKRDAAEIAARRVDISDNVQYHKLNGLWFQVNLEPFPKGKDLDYASDKILGLVTERSARHFYGKSVRAKSKRQLSSRELKKSGLKNAA